jgi:hypothetical protein
MISATLSTLLLIEQAKNHPVFIYGGLVQSGEHESCKLKTTDRNRYSPQFLRIKNENTNNTRIYS